MSWDESIFLPVPRGQKVANASEESIQSFEEFVGFRLPPEMRALLAAYNDRNIVGGLLVGPAKDYTHLGPTQNVGHLHDHPVKDTFDTWINDWGIISAVGRDWIPSLVEIVGGYHGVFYYDFAYDNECPAVVYLDGEWDLFRTDREPSMGSP